MANYGVFSEGQIWTLCSSNGWTRGYARRADAVAAAAEALAREPPNGGATLLLQDETSFVSAPDLRVFIGQPAPGN